MTKISVAAVGMNPIDRKLLKSLFLLSDQNQYGFELVDGEKAQLVVVDIDGMDDAALKAYKESHPGQPILHVSVTGGHRPGADPHITKPLKVNVVFEELNKLTQQSSARPVPVARTAPKLQPVPAKKPAKVSTVASSDAPTFDPNEFLAGLLRQAVKNKADTVISLGNQGRLVLSPNTNRYISSIKDDDLEDACRLSADSYTVTPAEAADIAELNGSDNRKPLDELLWVAGFYASDGRLPEGSLRNDVVTVDHWPNLTRLPSTENAIAICALLSRYPTSITLATRMLKLKPEEMYTFYSAAKLSGAARATNRTDDLEKEPEIREPAVSKGLLGKLFNKVKGM